MQSPQGFLVLLVLASHLDSSLGLEQSGDHADRPRGVGHVHHLGLVLWGNLDGSMLTTGGSPADEQRNPKSFAL